MMSSRNVNVRIERELLMESTQMKLVAREGSSHDCLMEMIIKDGQSHESAWGSTALHRKSFCRTSA